MSVRKRQIKQGLEHYTVVLGPHSLNNINWLRRNRQAIDANKKKNHCYF
jgi:hypothetical protein